MHYEYYQKLEQYYSKNKYKNVPKHKHMRSMTLYYMGSIKCLDKDYTTGINHYKMAIELHQEFKIA